MTDSVPSAVPAGFRMPAEWEPQTGIWLSWPHNPATWPGVMNAVQKAYALFAGTITQYEKLFISTGNKLEKAIRTLLRNAGARMDRVTFFPFPTNDAWCRDHGPVFVTDGSELAVVDFTYNAWGGKFPPWDLDDAVPRHAAETLKLRRFRIPIVCEGGALEVNGSGTLITTESVVLNPNRNPGLSRESAERILGNALGVRKVVWLESGLPGDDTDGHADTLARFFEEKSCLAVSAPGVPALEHNRKRLEEAGIATVGLPCPPPIRPKGWRENVLPASYANFLLVNGAVLVPTYRSPDSDSRALAILRECFPGRDVLPFDCFDILLEGGALHCLSQQQPEIPARSNNKSSE